MYVIIKDSFLNQLIPTAERKGDSFTSTKSLIYVTRFCFIFITLDKIQHLTNLLLLLVKTYNIICMLIISKNKNN